MKFIKFILKVYFVLFVIGIGMSFIDGFGNDYEETTYNSNYTSNNYSTNEYTENYYVEETEAWSDTHTTAPVPDPAVRGEDYLGAFTTADGTSDIDFYEVDGKVYFGEMTFFHCSGFESFHPSEWDKIFGDWITLPSKTVGENNDTN